MAQNEFNSILRSLNALSPNQMRQLRRELDDRLASMAVKTPDGQSMGSIGAMRDDAEFLDQIVEDAMRNRQEQPWRLSPSE